MSEQDSHLRKNESPSQAVQQHVFEEALQESERRFRATFEQAAVGIAHVAIDGHWLLVNKKLCQIVGYTREELMSLTFQDITYPEDLETDLAYVNSLLVDDLQTYSMEKRYFRKGGAIIWINLTVSLVRDMMGEPLYFIAVVEDISERRRVEEERMQLLAYEVETRAALERLNQMQDAFIAIISHEFRTTLTSIRGFSELLSDQIFPPEEVQEFAAAIHSNAQRLHRLIDDVLDLDQMKSGHLSLHLTEVDLNEIIRLSVEHMRPTTAKHTFRLDLAPSLPCLLADSDKMFQVLGNLLSNAIKYSPAGGEITVQTVQEKELLHCCVGDQGVGIPSHELENIFTPYSRIGVEKTRYIQGTGLGLAIVKNIIAMHHGEIWVTSTYGHGSQFHFTLPLQR